MRKVLGTAVMGVVFFLAATAYGENADALLGKWWNQEKDVQIEIYSCDGKYCGKIVWLKRTQLSGR